MPLINLVKQAARVSGSPSILGIVVALSMQILSGSAHSQTSYPNRPVTLVVPVPQVEFLTQWPEWSCHLWRKRWVSRW